MHFQNVKRTINMLFQYIIVMKNVQRRLLANQEHFICKVKHQTRGLPDAQKNIDEIRVRTVLAFGLEYGLYGVVGHELRAESFERTHQETLQCLQRQWGDILWGWISDKQSRDLLLLKLRSFVALSESEK